ncbi:hypothetical protein [Emcibacter sp. SYSU 3D8]|uniref:hypothetical protein n=1 Tax=Emcibacter sp. SYSU 3D8 TaxID=3133969 RepID=UPI0031FEDEFD
MGLREFRFTIWVLTAGALLAGCGVKPRETRDEKRYVRICTQYIGEKYTNADALCRCQWRGIRAEVPKEDLDEFFFKLTAGRRFETRASKLVDRIADKCLAQLGPNK